VEGVVGKIGELRHEGADVVPVRIVALGLRDGVEDAESAPQPVVHCQLKVLAARSASTSVFQNQRAPRCQCSIRSLVRNDAMIMRTRLCIQPVS